MKYEFMFLCLVVLILDHPRAKINVMLKPLIDELKELWNRVEAYDSHKKQKFTLWSIHDFMAYGIFVGWSIHGRLTCLICRSDTNCFCLIASGKINYFDCHRRWLPPKHLFRMQKGPPNCLSGPETTENLSKLVLNREENGYEGYGEEHNWTHICALWELSYAQALILIHNIDVMHQEHNIAKSIISTCMYIMGKTKDNFKALRDIEHVCNRPSLELNERGGKHHAPFVLKVKDRKEVMRWMKKLKFTDGYAVGLKRCVNVTAGKIHRYNNGKTTASNVTWIP
jgi:hypothetical protein